MSKIIEVYRHYNLVEMQQQEPEVKAWLGEAYRPIGPYFDGKKTATGLTFEEQNILMPEVLGIEKSDKDFRKAVIKYFDEILTNVPKDGLKLEAGLYDDSKPLSADNLPIVPKDYIVYRHLLGHPHVALDRTTAAREQNKRFFVLDTDKAALEAVKINTLEDKAISIYFKFKDDSIKIDQILTMLGVDIRSMSKDEKVIKLKSFTTKASGTSELQQKEIFDKFIKIAEDQDLEMKFLIEEMIGAQYLRRVGANIVYEETGKLVGENMQDAVLYFKNAKNSRELNLLKAEYQMKMKKGDEYLPKTEPTVATDPKEKIVLTKEEVKTP